jgi:hypothetical protein
MPHIAPQRSRNANVAAAPSGTIPEPRHADATSESLPPRRSGRGAELGVRILWLVLGFAAGISVGMIWSASVFNAN